jgi:hypothetical protein
LLTQQQVQGGQQSHNRDKNFTRAMPNYRVAGIMSGTRHDAQMDRRMAQIEESVARYL